MTFGTKLAKSIHHVLVVQEADEEEFKIIFLSSKESGQFAKKFVQNPDLGQRKMCLIDPHGQVVQGGNLDWKNPFDKSSEENESLRFALIQALVIKGDIARLRKSLYAKTLKQWLRTLSSSKRLYFRKTMTHILSLLPESRGLLERSPLLREAMQLKGNTKRNK